MGGTDAAGGQDIVEGGADLVDGVDDDVLDIGDDAGLAHTHTGLAEHGGHVVQVGVLGASRQDLVADDQHAGGVDAFSHASSLSPGERRCYQFLGVERRERNPRVAVALEEDADPPVR